MYLNIYLKLESFYERTGSVLISGSELSHLDYFQFYPFACEFHNFDFS